MDFIKPLDVGRKLIVVSSIQEIQSERQVLVTGEIYSDEGKLCDKANGKFVPISSEFAVQFGMMSSE